MNHEIEIKFKVETRENLAALENRASDIFPDALIKQVQQTNYFFDTADFAVRKNAIRMRLRKQDQHYFLTLKGPSDSKGTLETTKLTQRLEFEAELSQAQADALLSEQHDPVWIATRLENVTPNMIRTRDHLLNLIQTACTDKPIKLIGSFTNQRRILPIEIEGTSMLLEFDETRFNNSIVQFEVELEIPTMEMFKKSESFLKDLFARSGQDPGYAKSKSERFFSYLTKEDASK